MGESLSYYDTLEVLSTASEAAIRGAYRGLSQKHHPDKNPENREQAEREMKCINEAFQILSDPVKRSKYDTEMARQIRASGDGGSRNPRHEVHRETNQYAWKDHAQQKGEAHVDPLYNQAVELVLKNRRASISLVQRHLKIGFNRAARLVEDMEKAGLVSAMIGNGHREILASAPAPVDPAANQPSERRESKSVLFAIVGLAVSLPMIWILLPHSNDHVEPTGTAALRAPSVDEATKKKLDSIFPPGPVASAMALDRDVAGAEAQLATLPAPSTGPSQTVSLSSQPSAAGIPILQTTEQALSQDAARSIQTQIQVLPGEVADSRGASNRAYPSWYFVQTGEFRTPQEAEAQRAKLALLGFEAKVSESDRTGQQIFGVRLGPFEDKEDADRQTEKLAFAGVETALIRVPR